MIKERVFIFVFLVSGDIPKPELLVKPDSAVYEGIKLIFECKTKGTFAKLSWEKEGKQVPYICSIIVSIFQKLINVHL